MQNPNLLSLSVLAAALALTAQITSAQPADPGADGDASADQRMSTSMSGGAERFSSQSIADAALVGIWQGSLRTGPFELRLVLNVRSTMNGAFAATLDSLDQGVLGLPVSTVEVGGNEVRFEVQRIRAAIEGSFDESKSAISGQWSQRGNTLPFPAVVLLSGSGPQNRNEELLGHRPFLVLADHLTRSGITVLRFDDRGIGKSGGNSHLATYKDFADDAQAAFKFLKSQPKIDPARVGLCGHSEGGLHAPIVAAARNDVAQREDFALFNKTMA